MKKKNLIFVAFIVLALFCVGCIDKQNDTDTSTTSVSDISKKTLDMTFEGKQDCSKAYDSNVLVYHDNDRNVTCCILTGCRKGGISCIPDEQIKQS
jgi:serine protease inhibitor